MMHRALDETDDRVSRSGLLAAHVEIMLAAGDVAAARAAAEELASIAADLSTSSYDTAYAADLPNAWGTGTSYLASSHVANGLVGTFGGETRAVFFTSGRVVQYAEADAPGSGRP